MKKNHLFKFIVFSSFLNISIANANTKPIIIDFLAGDITVTNAQGIKLQVNKNTKIFSGYRISTSKGIMQLTLNDGSQLSLQSYSEIQFNHTQNKPVVTIHHGGVRLVSVPANGTAVILNSIDGYIQPKGDYVASYDRFMKISQITGTGNFCNQGGCLKLAARETGYADKNTKKPALAQTAVVIRPIQTTPLKRYTQLELIKPIVPGEPTEPGTPIIPGNPGEPGTPIIPGDPGVPVIPTDPPKDIIRDGLVFSSAHIRSSNAYTYVSNEFSVTFNTHTGMATYAEQSRNVYIEDSTTPSQTSSIGAIENFLSWGRWTSSRSKGIPAHNVQGNAQETPYVIVAPTSDSYFSELTNSGVTSLVYAMDNYTAPVFHNASGTTTVGTGASGYSNVNFNIDVTALPMANLNFTVDYINGDTSRSAVVSGLNMPISGGMFQTNTATCSSCDNAQGSIAGAVGGSAAAEAGVVYALPLLPFDGGNKNEGLTGSLIFIKR